MIPSVYYFYIKTNMLADFQICISVLLTLASDKAVSILQFQIFSLSNKKRYSSFLKKVFAFQNIKVLKTLILIWFSWNWFSDLNIKTWGSLKRRAILKVPIIIFQRNLCFFCLLQNEPLRKTCQKTCWKEKPLIFCLFDESNFQTSVHFKMWQWNV